jgi:hypothetical protein
LPLERGVDPGAVAVDVTHTRREGSQGAGMLPACVNHARNPGFGAPQVERILDAVPDELLGDLLALLLSPGGSN